MLILDRAVRIRDEATLPSGRVLSINVDVESNLKGLLAAFGAVVSASGRWQDERTDENARAFYVAFAGFLETLLGSAMWATLLNEYEADERELCEAFTPWVFETVLPAIEDASARKVEEEKRRRSWLRRRRRR